MSFQYLPYKKLKANLLDFYNDEVNAHGLADVINKSETDKKLDRFQKYKKAQLESLFRFINELDNVVYNVPVKKEVRGWFGKTRDKRTNLVEDHNISEARKAKILTGKIKSMVGQLRQIEGQNLEVDAKFLELLPTIIGESEKNKFDQQAAVESHDALRLFKTISFAKLTENISKIGSDRAEYDELQALIKEINAELFEDRRSATQPWLEDEKTAIVIGKLLYIKELYESWRFSNATNSRLYKGILPAIGLQGDKVDETFALYAKRAYDQYMFMKQPVAKFDPATGKASVPAQSVTRLQNIHEELKFYIPTVEATKVEVDGKKTIGTTNGIFGLQAPKEKRAPLTQKATYLDEIEHFDKSVLGARTIKPEIRKSESTALKAYKNLSRETLQRENVAPQIRNVEEISLKPVKTVEKNKLSIIDELEQVKSSKLKAVRKQEKSDRSAPNHTVLGQIERFDRSTLKPTVPVVKHGTSKHEDNVFLPSLMTAEQEIVHDKALLGEAAGFSAVMAEVKSFNHSSLKKLNVNKQSENKAVLFKNVHDQLLTHVKKEPAHQPGSPSLTRK